MTILTFKDNLSREKIVSADIYEDYNDGTIIAPRGTWNNLILPALTTPRYSYDGNLIQQIDFLTDNNSFTAISLPTYDVALGGVYSITNSILTIPITGGTPAFQSFTTPTTPINNATWFMKFKYNALGTSNNFLRLIIASNVNGITGDHYYIKIDGNINNTFDSISFTTYNAATHSRTTHASGIWAQNTEWNILKVRKSGALATPRIEVFLNGELMFDYTHGSPFGGVGFYVGIETANSGSSLSIDYWSAKNI